VFSVTSEEADWDGQIADLIRSGKASVEDEFMRIGWMPENRAGFAQQQNAAE
jgi:hypothetical protein